jgi:hypothetical protein
MQGKTLLTHDMAKFQVDHLFLTSIIKLNVILCYMHNINVYQTNQEI